MGRNRKRNRKAKAEQGEHKTASTAQQHGEQSFKNHAQYLSEQLKKHAKQLNKQHASTTASKRAPQPPRVRRPLPQLPHEIVESIVKVRLRQDLYRSWGRVKDMMSVSRALNSLARRYVRSADQGVSGLTYVCREPRAETIICNALKEVLYSKPNAKLFLQFQKALCRWWPPSGRPFGLYDMYSGRACPLLFEEHAAIKQLPMLKYFQDVPRDVVAEEQGDVDALVAFNAKDAQRIRKNGLLFIILICRVFAMRIPAGATIQLNNPDRRQRSPHIVYEALRMAIERRKEQVNFRFEQVEPLQWGTDDGQDSSAEEEDDEGEDAHARGTSLAMYYDIENASSEDSFFSNNHDPSRYF